MGVISRQGSNDSLLEPGIIGSAGLIDIATLIVEKIDTEIDNEQIGAHILNSTLHSPFWRQTQPHSLFLNMNDAVEFANTTVPSHWDNRSTIFVMGCPRSGTTLVSQLLSSHSEISLYHESFLYHRKLQSDLVQKGCRRLILCLA